ncbi:MAG TPA: hypothetical protein VKB75_18505 [Jatrophihabitans sp.]|nr:hypothetical protein [Jatrophihabitans sp.]
MVDEPVDAPAAGSSERQRMVVGLLTAPGLSQQVADHLARQLPARLAQRHPEFEWHVVLRAEPLLGTPGVGVDLVQLAREQIRREGWQLAICLTDLPLHAGRRTLTAQASVVLGVGLVSLPALGPVDLDERALQATMRVIDTLLQRDVARRAGSKGGRRAWPRLPDVRQVASPLGHVDTPDEATVRYIAAPAAGTLRLLLGLVRSNRPWRFITGLSRALVAALGVGAFGLCSPAIWQVAHAMTWSRLLIVAVGSLIAIALTLIVAHGLWDRGAPLSLRNPVTLINIATVTTVVLGVLTLFAALLIITVACGAALIPGEVLTSQLKHPFAVSDYFRIGWVVTSLATIGGALGAAVESDLAVREAAYGLRPTNDEQSASDGG